MEQQISKKAAGQRRRKKLAGLLVKLALLSFLCFALGRFLYQQPLLNQYDEKISQLTQEIEKEKKSTQQYENLKKLYETDDYKKQLARERLGLVESNERVYVDVSGQ